MIKMASFQMGVLPSSHLLFLALLQCILENYQDSSDLKVVAACNAQEIEFFHEVYLVGIL